MFASVTGLLFPLFLWIFIISQITSEILPSLSLYLFAKRNTFIVSMEGDCFAQKFRFKIIDYNHWIANNQPYIWNTYTYWRRFHPFKKTFLVCVVSLHCVRFWRAKRTEAPVLSSGVWWRERGTRVEPPCGVVALQWRVWHKAALPWHSFDAVRGGGWRLERYNKMRLKMGMSELHRYNSLSRPKGWVVHV